MITLIVMLLVVIMVNMIFFVFIYRFVRTTVSDFLGEKEYEYQLLVREIEKEKIEMRAYMNSLISVYKDYMEKGDVVIRRVVNVMWKDFDEKSREIIFLYLRGYNINEISAKTGLSVETVRFTLMVALGQEVDKDA